MLTANSHMNTEHTLVEAILEVSGHHMLEALKEHARAESLGLVCTLKQ